MSGLRWKTPIVIDSSSDDEPVTAAPPVAAPPLSAPPVVAPPVVAPPVPAPPRDAEAPAAKRRRKQAPAAVEEPDGDPQPEGKAAPQPPLDDAERRLLHEVLGAAGAAVVDGMAPDAARALYCEKALAPRAATLAAEANARTDALLQDPPARLDGEVADRLGAALLATGCCVVPIPGLAGDGARALREGLVRRLEAELRAMPAVADPDAFMAQPMYGAFCATPLLTHSVLVRALRLAVHAPGIAVLRGFVRAKRGGDARGWLACQMMDQVLYRLPRPADSKDVDLHRDLAPLEGPPGTRNREQFVFGGWLNLNPDAEQGLHALLGTQDDAVVHTTTPGFAHTPEFPKKSAALQACWRALARVRIPPGCMLMFNEAMVHGVHIVRQPHVEARLFTAWQVGRADLMPRAQHDFLYAQRLERKVTLKPRDQQPGGTVRVPLAGHNFRALASADSARPLATTESESGWILPLAETLRDQGVPFLKSGQVPPLYPANWACWTKSDKWKRFVGSFVPQWRYADDDPVLSRRGRLFRYAPPLRTSLPPERQPYPDYAPDEVALLKPGTVWAVHADPVERLLRPLATQPLDDPAALLLEPPDAAVHLAD